MPNIKEIIISEEAMLTFGARLAKAAQPGCVIGLSGDLGAGKTTLSRGFLHALGHEGAVKSPTYTLVEPYQLKNYQIFHFDLYRIQDPEELSYMGIDDYFTEEAICLIEWPEKGRGMLPSFDVTCDLQIDHDSRCVTVQSHSPLGEQIVSEIST